MSADPVILVSGLKKAYGNRPILDALDLAIRPGTLNALVGPNGTGKSTLLRLLLRLDTPDAGEVRVFGRSIHEDDPAFNADVGYVSEEIAYTLGGDLASLTRLLRRVYDRWDERTFAELRTNFGLDLARGFHELSRGQKMQFAFAVACAKRPRLLVLDEITAVLDPGVRLAVVTFLKRFCAAGGTVVLATNVMSEVHGAADRLIILGPGRVVFDRSASDFDGLFVKLRRRADDDHGIFHAPGCRDVGANPDGSLSYLAPRTDVRLPPEILDRRGVTPEDLFVYHTKKAV